MDTNTSLEVVGIGIFSLTILCVLIEFTNTVCKKVCIPPAKPREEPLLSEV
jgi:hypothetical protein